MNMNDNVKIVMDKIKKNVLCFVAEVVVLFYDIYVFLSSGNRVVTIILSSFFFIFIIIHIIINKQYKNNKKDIPDDLKFMVEFSDSIGYTDKKKTKSFSDDNCKIDSIKKTYKIDGVNVEVEKIYVGRVCSNTCDGIKIMTCGGSSNSSSKLIINTSLLNEGTQKYSPISFNVVTEDERTKLIKVKFGKILSKNDKFTIKYTESKWLGAMREEYDGVVIGEHLFYKSLVEQTVILNFENINSVECAIYKYNFKTGEIIKLDVNIVIDKNICNYSLKESQQDCIYFFMYNYK